MGRNYTLEEAVALDWTWGIPVDLPLFLKGLQGDALTARINAYVWYAYNVRRLPILALIAFYLFLLLFLLCYPLSRLVPSRISVPLHNLYSRHLVLASTIHGYAAEPIPLVSFNRSWAQWTTIQIPRKPHSLALFFFILCNLLLIFGFYDLLIPNSFWPEDGYPYIQIGKYVADRTAIIAFALTPFTVLLGMRHSPFTFIGIPFSTLQIYHRWAARMTFLHATVHSIIYLWFFWNHLGRQFHKPYWNWGVAAYAGGIVLCVASQRRLRELAYETFLFFHVSANTLWLVGSVFHVSHLHHSKHLRVIIYPAFLAWFLDRAIRGYNLLSTNISRTPKSGFPRNNCQAYGILINQGNYIRLVIRTRRVWTENRAGAGTYVFLSIASLLGIHQSHPFTIAWPIGFKDPFYSSRSAVELQSPSEDERSRLFPHPQEVDDQTDCFELVIKVYDGFTRTLRDQLVARRDRDLFNEGGEDAVPLNLVVQGPFGVGHEVESFRHLVLVSGGTGISGTLAHLAQLEKVTVSENFKAFEVEKIIMVWSIRDVDACFLLIPYLKRIVNIKTLLDLRVHYTRSWSKDENELDPLESIVELFATHVPWIPLQVEQGRPIMSPYISEILDWSDTRSSVVPPKTLVGCCGPPGLCDKTREAVRDAVGTRVDARHMDFLEESFLW